ncbi:hypothetical protein H2201_005246 [Coniosporium apollinis]|uniref:PRELI/MSF1 domain-containing protein n=2 Tax=Coniosporium TaxID=2810619 RepID=A0ABQ9NRT1_9PEZI|nr:hypothetical protein H2199_004221 [Cladosporium sp. JES 115]KAJ9664254.1 hypothetical protein H2201_005246 [Coniosporium apollinis]
MVKFYSSTDTYSYPFSAVSLAYFLRYPNPHATHVLSTDTIDRHYDPTTQTLTTTRLHLKRSKLPAPVLKLVPRSLLGAGKDGDSQAYILETSVVDVKAGTMETESRNLEWTGVLSVVEKQLYRRPQMDTGVFGNVPNAAAKHGFLKAAPDEEETCHVTTTVTLHSRLGERWKQRRAARSPTPGEPGLPRDVDEEPEEKVGFLRSWSQASIQRSIELIGLRRAERSQPNAKKGMKVVLQRLRQGGLVAVLEGMRRDREMALGGAALVQQPRVWGRGGGSEEGDGEGEE